MEEKSTTQLRQDQFEATLEWLDSKPLLPGRTYLFTLDQQHVPATITKLKYRINTNSQKKEPVNTLGQHETGVINFSLANSIEYDEATQNDLLAFTLFDPEYKTQLARGTINHSLRRATNIRWQLLDIDKSARASLLDQKPCVIWLTGFSGSGKSTIANLVEKKLYAQGLHSYLLDGDNVRHGLNKDLGFTDADRVENIRRIAETAKLMVDAGLIVLTSFISPFRTERQMARKMLGDGEFIEVFVDAPIELCEQRDPKGLYKKARNGQIKNFTGFDSPYEKPETAEIVIDTATQSAEQAAEKIVTYLSRP